MPENVVAIRLGDDGLPEFNVTQVPGLIQLRDDGLYIVEGDGVQEVEDGILYTIPLAATIYGDPDTEARESGVRTAGRVVPKVRTEARVVRTVGIEAKVEVM